MGLFGRVRQPRGETGQFVITSVLSLLMIAQVGQQAITLQTK
jgi:hypothetical protein